MEQSSKIFFSTAKGKKYFKASIPFDIAINILGLRRDVKGQNLIWKIENGQVVVTKG
jgi:hypothetical protein